MKHNLLFPLLLLTTPALADTTEVKDCSFVPINRPSDFRTFDASKYVTVWSCQGVSDILMSRSPELYEKAKERMRLVIEMPKDNDGVARIVGIGENTN